MFDSVAASILRSGNIKMSKSSSSNNLRKMLD
jgi:hypothetical protein